MNLNLLNLRMNALFSAEVSNDTSSSTTAPTTCPTTTTTTTIPPPTYLPELEQKGYQLIYGFGYYKLNRKRLSWGDAVEACRRDGTHLLILNSDAEARLVGQHMRLSSVTGHDCWTGVHDIFKEGHYITIFSKYHGVHLLGYYCCY